MSEDQLVLRELFVKEFRALDVYASDGGATMDEQRNVEVNRCPKQDWNRG